jgi:hypothetical protein
MDTKKDNKKEIFLVLDEEEGQDYIKQCIEEANKKIRENKKIKRNQRPTNG